MLTSPLILNFLLISSLAIGFRWTVTQVIPVGALCDAQGK